MAELVVPGYFDLAASTSGLKQLEPLRGLVAVDLLHVELAHEVDRLGGRCTWPGTMIGKPGG